MRLSQSHASKSNPPVRFVVDAGAALYLASAEVEVAGAHKLLAPTLLRSQTLSVLHEAVQRGEIPADVARDHLTRIARIPDSELVRSIEGIVATASIDALR